MHDVKQPRICGNMKVNILTKNRKPQRISVYLEKPQWCTNNTTKMNLERKFKLGWLIGKKED